MTISNETARVMETGMRLSAAQSAAAEGLKDCERAAAQQRAKLHQLSDDVRVLEEILPVKRAALDRATNEYAVMVTLLRNYFSLFRDLMELTPEPELEPESESTAPSE